MFAPASFSGRTVFITGAGIGTDFALQEAARAIKGKRGEAPLRPLGGGKRCAKA